MVVGPDVAPPPGRQSDSAGTDSSNARSSELSFSANLESSGMRLPLPAAGSSGISSHRPLEVSATAPSVAVLVAHLRSDLKLRRQKAFFYGAKEILIVTQRRAT